MQVLLTNDDGIEAEGLQAMRRALVQVPGIELAVIAPDGNRSAFARMITTRRPLWVQQVPFEDGTHGFATDGTPVDCVRLAKLGLIEGFDADIVVAGINHGSNLGDDITYSGTVAAALEALVLGIPGIAVSQQSNAREMDFRLGSRFEFERAADFVARVVAELDEVPLPAGHAAEHQRPRGRAPRRPGHAPGQAHLPRRAQARRRGRGRRPALLDLRGRPGLPRRAGHRPRRRARGAHRGHARALRPHRRLRPRRPDQVRPGAAARPGRPRGAVSKASKQTVERAAQLREELTEHGRRYYVLDDPAHHRRPVRPAARRAARHRGRAPRAADARLADAAHRRRAGLVADQGHPPPADALAGQRAQRGGAARVDRAHAQPPRARGHRGSGVPVRRRAQDRRAGHLARLPRRRAGDRGDARQRRGRRGRHPQPAHDPDHPAAHRRRRRAAAARGPRRGLHVAGRLRRAQRAPRRAGPVDLHEPAQLGRGDDPPARPQAHRASARCRCGPTASASPRGSASRAIGTRCSG